MLRRRLVPLGALAALLAGGIGATYQRPPRLSFDSPALTRPPRDTGLIASARRSVGNDAKRREAEEKRLAEEKRKKEQEEAEDRGLWFDDEDTSAWAHFSRDFNGVREGIARFEWAGVGGKLTDYIVPAWARSIPEAIQKLQFELSMKPGSLADDIWEEAHDSSINPEILLDARVRISSDLCREEKVFRLRRQEHLVTALAKYLDLNPEDVDPEDVPVIGLCGSGGGLRAMVAGTSSYLSAQKAGLLDCVTYTAGVSGSCWMQVVYNSSLAGQDYHKLIDHLKNRIGTHIAYPPAALKLVTSAPTHKYLLSGFIEKLKGDPKCEFGLVDIYGGLLAARLLVPHGDLGISDRDLKLSNQRAFIDDGRNPMPIYTAVRHEIPVDREAEQKANDKDDKSLIERVKEKARKEAWFQWFEFTPYETFCEEFGAGIPTWAVGRPFNRGRNELLDSGVGLPEIRIPILMAIWGSAFCATLSHYYKEIRPIVKGLAGFGGLDAMLEEKNEDLIKIHPIEPATIPNFVTGMKGMLPRSCPDSVFSTDHIQLMDAGMSNNLPIYPLLRPGRDVDILIAFDASADVQRENWLSVVDGYAKQRGIRGWPMGAGWPHKSTKAEETAQAIDEAESTSSQEAATKLAETREKRRKEAAEKDKQSSKGPHDDADSDLGYCTVWLGRSEERTSKMEPPPDKSDPDTSTPGTPMTDTPSPDPTLSQRLNFSFEDDTTVHLTSPTAGLALIYFPLLPNPKVPGVDPDKTDFMSTWNFIYTPEDIDKVVALAKANFEEGESQVKRTVRAVYQRKKAAREKMEGRRRIKVWERRLKDGEVGY